MPNNFSQFLDALFQTRSIKPLFAYGLAFPFIILPPASVLVPFILPNLPLELLFGSSFFAQIFSGFIYGIISTYTGLSVLTTLLIEMILIENIIEFTEQICNRACNNNLLSQSHKRFYEFCHGYRMAQILINCTNSILCVFVVNLTFMGILLGSCAAYITVKMYGEVHFIIYLCGTSLTIICFVVAIVFTYLVGLPYKNLETFKTYWLTKVHCKENRKVLRSLRSCGFQMGPYGVSTSKLGVKICDDIIQNTVTVLLLGSA